MKILSFIVSSGLVFACGCGPGPTIADGGRDAGVEDGGTDSGVPDAGDGGELSADAGDSGVPAADAGDAGEPDSGDGGFVEAPHDAFPQIPDQGGPVIAHPWLVSVTFAGDPWAAQAVAYDRWIAQSGYLAQAGEDYGVGDGPVPEAYAIDGGFPDAGSASDVAAFLAGAFDAGVLPAPSAGEGRLYVLHLPAGAPFSGLCLTVFGFHAAATWQGVPYGYAVTPECTEDATGFPEPENLELVVSHEVIEEATDPFNGLAGEKAGWAITDPSEPWYGPGEGEVADLCEGQVASLDGGAYDFSDGGFYVSTVWSNRQAADGGGSPCFPGPDGPYFNVSPEKDEVHEVAAGESVTVELTGWSTAPVAPWLLYEMAYFGDFDPNAQFPDGGTIGNGTSLPVVLSVPDGGTSGSRAEAWIGSYADGSPDITSFWPISIRVR